jgi:hypothetical protein
MMHKSSVLDGEVLWMNLAYYNSFLAVTGFLIFSLWVDLNSSLLKSLDHN